jgi:hypothetical protein
MYNKLGNFFNSEKPRQFDYPLHFLAHAIYMPYAMLKAPVPSITVVKQH